MCTERSVSRGGRWTENLKLSRFKCHHSWSPGPSHPVCHTSQSGLGRVWLSATPCTVAWLLCPWDSSSKNTEARCHFLPQGCHMRYTWTLIAAFLISCPKGDSLLSIQNPNNCSKCEEAGWWVGRLSSIRSVVTRHTTSLTKLSLFQGCWHPHTVLESQVTHQRDTSYWMCSVCD